MKKLFATILMCCSLACASPDKIPDDVMSIEQMKPIVWDMMRAGILVQNQFRLDTANQKKEAVANYQKVFAVHSTTKDAFYHSYQYYLDHPDKHKVLLDSVVAYANRERIDLFKKIHEKEKIILLLFSGTWINLPHFNTPAMNKVFANADDAIQDLQNGDTIMLGGFGLCGIPENCIAALVRKGAANLTCISNNAGVDDFGLGLLLKTRQIKKMISSYVGENAEFERQLLSGELEVDLIPQGTLATRIQMAGMGIPAFFTPAGYGTEIAEGKEVREFNGKMHLMEHSLHARFALVKAWKGDTMGNLVFRKTTRNFSTSMAKAGDITIAEVEELVEPGTLNPDEIHVAGVYVHRIFKGGNYAKRIERKTTSIK